VKCLNWSRSFSPALLFDVCGQEVAGWGYREAFRLDVSDIPISHNAVRLRALAEMVEKAKSRGNFARAAALLEQAAKEVVNFYVTSAPM
jgi:hypothetical protein